MVSARAQSAAKPGGFSRSTNAPGLNIKSSRELMSAIASKFDLALQAIPYPSGTRAGR
ncbi:hypothetical protein [Microcoleus asticus]|uniref:hypothetical protein n=1 Tax=Microcoleus asticus TaxID=2815231 RepID=UPI001557B9D9|nr:hypothetical protein [Microcoleus asticus]